MTSPTLNITIKRIGPAERHEYEATLTRADNQAEISVNTFTFDPDLLIDMEPQWMLDKAVPRTIDDAVRGEKTAQEYAAEQAQKLAGYGQRLYGFLFGDGRDLQSFLKFNDAYAPSAHLTLALHSNAAVLWRLPWEYIHDDREFLALHGKFQLSRRPYELGELARDPIQLPLRLLVIISSPEDQAELNTEKEISAIQEALDEAERRGLIQTQYLDDATLEAIGDALKMFNPHVIHYTGHGVYRPQEERSYLALERENGKTKLAGIRELRPHLQNAPALRLALLSGCQTAQTSDSDAFSGVATGMLEAGIPAVVAMQFSILDSSGIRLARAFYTALAQGESLAAAMQATRISLWQFEEGPGYDWGIPALYLRTAGMVLVDADQDLTGLPNLSGLTPSSLINVGGLPLPRHFVGRKGELRQLRRALRDNQTKSAFIRGIGGMGKSSLAAKLAQRPGVELDGLLVIRCHEVDALDIPGKIASFLQGQGVPGHAEAGNMLLNPTLDPADRARRAAQLVADRRYLFVFDNFESVQAVPGITTTAAAVADANLAGLLRGLLTANWRSLCLFTGRYRWQGYEEMVQRDVGREIHLPELTAPQALMLMNNLSRLRQEPREVKIAMYRKVGGHPKTIELLNGWLADGRVRDLLGDERLDGLLTAQWEEYFLARLLARLSDDERAALTRLSIFQARLGTDELAYAGVTEGMTRRWLDLSLLQRERGEAVPLPPQLADLLELLPPAEQEKALAQRQAPDSYTVHPVVADYLLAQLDEPARAELHRWAAVFYGRPFVEMARQMVRPGMTVTEEQIEAFVRDRDGVVGQMVARTDDMDAARGAMARALAWQRHLFAAGAVAAADDIVNAVIEVLARWGERDRAKGLLRRSIASLEGDDSRAVIRKAAAQGNLATLLKDEGKLAEALATYQAVYDTFAALGTKQQMAAALSSMASIYMNQGDIDNAIKYEERSMVLEKERGNEEGQAISLHQLAILYHLKEEYETALARSQAAEAIDRKRGDQAGLAADLHEQGIIYDKMARATAAVSEEERGEYRETAQTAAQTAVARFQDSLAIKRRIGNEAGAANTLGELGKLLRDAGHMDEAIAAFNEALAIARKLNDPVSVAIRLEFLGSVHEEQEQYAAALAKYREALALKQKYMPPRSIAITENNIARVQAKLGGG